MRDQRITRRNLVQAAGITLGAGVAGASASTLASPADPDAGLFDRLRRHGEAEAAVRRAQIASDKAFAIYLATVPPSPDVLRWREGDFPGTGFGPVLRDHDRDGAPQGYSARAADWLQEQEPFPAWAARVGASMSTPDVEACEARRLEIVAAWNHHTAARRAVEIGTGYAAACDVLDGAADLLLDLAAEIARTRPRTLPGLRALAAWFGSRVENDQVNDNFLELFAETVAGFGMALA